jgi:HEAT repeat protein
MIHFLCTALLGLCLLAASPVQAAQDADMAPGDEQMAALYWQGQEALKESDWNAALERFRRLETELRRSEPASADAAIYWQAYALLQARRTTEARATLEKLGRDYPHSRWSEEADSLMRQIRAATKPASITTGDDDLAEIAITGLMQAPPERAIPILRKVLQGSHSVEVKKRALFVLSQLDEESALAMLGDIATHATDAELRSEAIRMLGISGEENAIERLRTIYASSKSGEEKRAILQAWMIADRPELVVQVARSEADEDVRKAAIQTLGMLDANKELRELFASEKSMENRKAILRAFGIAGDAATLGEIAASSEPEEIRIAAIEALGIADDDHSGATLMRLYANGSAGIREAALRGLMIRGDSDSMRKLYRQAKTTEEKKSLLRMLTITDSDGTLDLIEAELDEGGNQP